MDFLTTWYAVDTVLIEIAGYPLSPIELIGTLTGLVSVWLASRAHIWTWPIGLINVVAFFIIFYQIRLYSDMFLQVYFFGMSLYGWWHWGRRDTGQARITGLSGAWRLRTAALLLLGTLALGGLMSQLPSLLPDLFPQPAAFPFADAFTTTASIIATIFLARKILEAWILWIAVDIVATILYFQKNVLFIAIEYLVFLGIASYGLYTWFQRYQHAQRTDPR